MAKSARCVPAVKYLKFSIETLRCTNCHVAPDKDLNHRLKLAIQDMLDERRREIETVYIKKRFGAKTLICFVFSKAGKAKQFKCGFGRKQLWQFYQSLRSMLLIEFCDNFVSLIFGKNEFIQATRNRSNLNPVVRRIWSETSSLQLLSF